MGVNETACMHSIGFESRLVALASVIELQSQAADIEVVAGRGCDTLPPCVMQRLLLHAALASDCPLSFKVDNVAQQPIFAWEMQASDRCAAVDEKKSTSP